MPPTFFRYSFNHSLIAGTSANPPTMAHRGIVQSLVAQQLFDEIWVLPVYQHIFSDKRNNLADFDDRKSFFVHFSLFLSFKPSFLSFFSISLSLSLSLTLSVCLYIYLSVFLSICISFNSVGLSLSLPRPPSMSFSLSSCLSFSHTYTNTFIRPLFLSLLVPFFLDFSFSILLLPFFLCIF